jgi:hypothetical protein
MATTILDIVPREKGASPHQSPYESVKIAVVNASPISEPVEESDESVATLAMNRHGGSGCGK